MDNNVRFMRERNAVKKKAKQDKKDYSEELNKIDKAEEENRE